MTVCLPEVRKRFADDLYATQTTGIEIVEVGELYVKCMLHLAAKHKNAMGAVMGGVLYTLADFAFAVAANYDTLTTVSISEKRQSQLFFRCRYCRRRRQVDSKSIDSGGEDKRKIVETR